MPPIEDEEENEDEEQGESNMLRVLLAKDLRRAWRNPLPSLINIALPLCITAVIGLTFGGKSDTGLGRIRFAVVDEDKSVLSSLLRGAANQREGGEHLDPVFLAREEALRQINDNKLSAVLIIPTNFMRQYLTGSQAVSLELIKNPAESIHPAVLEELLGVVVTGLNALSRNFQSEFPEWQGAFAGDLNHHKIAALVERVGNKVEAARKFINPPLVSYDAALSQEGQSESKIPSPTTQALPEGEQTSPRSNAVPLLGGARGGSVSNAKPASNLAGIFSFVLVGMSAMFLLFLASNGMSDLQRELRNRTFERYQTMREQLLPFVAGKVVFTVVLLMLCSVVMLGGGGLVFRVEWRQPFALAVLTISYACFAAGLMGLLMALAADERRAAVLNNIAGMALGMAGGCMFPRSALPQFVGEHITPLLPSYWFVEAARNLQQGGANVAWGFVTLKLAALSAVLIVLAVVLLQRRFKKGLRA